MSVVADDTSPDAMAVVVDHWRGMSPAAKLEQVAAANRSCERLAEIGVRSRYPSASSDEIRRRVTALRLGRELMVAAFGWDPVAEGW